MGPKPRGGSQLGSLQAGRGIAALAVAIHHGAYATAQFVAPLPGWLAVIFHQGLLGVDFFFVLSGFIILNAHLDDAPTVAAFRSYVFKRIIRIYVPYLPIALMLIAAYFLLPGLSRNTREWGWLTSIFLIPSSHPPALASAWTLVHEILFYTIFSLYFFSRRLFGVVILFWAMAMLSLAPPTLALGAEPETLSSALLNPINLEFCFGLVAALAYRFIDVRHSSWLVLLGLAIVALFFLLVGEPDRVVFGLGMALLVLGMALREKSGRLAVPSILVALGDASYAIYLLHVPLIALLVRLAARVPLLDTWAGSLLMLSVCAAICGYAYYSLYERPALRAVRKIMLRPALDSSDAALRSFAPQ